MRTDRVVLLTCEGEPGRIAARYLAARFPAVTVIVEDPVPRLSAKPASNRAGPMRAR